MKVTLDPSVLSVMPHLTFKLDGRAINFAPIWDGMRWREWLPTDAELMEISVADVTEGGYFAKESARSDWRSPLDARGCHESYEA